MCPAAHKVELCFPVTPTSDKLHVGGFTWQRKDLYRFLNQKDVPDDNSSPYSHEHVHYTTCSNHTKSIPSLRVRTSFDSHYRSTVPLNVSLQWDFCKSKMTEVFALCTVFCNEPSVVPPKAMSSLVTEYNLRLGFKRQMSPHAKITLIFLCILGKGLFPCFQFRFLDTQHPILEIWMNPEKLYVASQR